mmetsp:Transcript_3722/g.5678  ORF Transcript_3722/g.5678 Transcript_3722/m.5678 type:complete len:897 (+) Transcript_3722:65-2755(+)
MIDDALVLEISSSDELRRVSVYSVKSWLSLLEYYERAGWKERRIIYELALRRVPRSYKLWLLYIREAEARCSEWLGGKGLIVKRLYERGLVQLHTCPRLWLGYCQILWHRREIKNCRYGFDRALRALPVSQHHLIWPAYTTFALECGEPLGSLVYHRRCMLEREQRIEFAEYLATKANKIGAAAAVLAQVIEDQDDQVSNKHKAWLRLCDLCCQAPSKVDCINVDAVIRGGLRRFTHDCGLLWCKLADFYIRSGAFEMARDVYEEAVNSVMSVKDFSIVFDKYAKFEEALLAAKIQAADDDDVDDDEVHDLDLRLARLEELIKRRPLLLSAVILRQNPHNVAEWLARAKIYEDNNEDAKALETYADAVKSVDPIQAVNGRSHSLWLALADFYIRRNHFEVDARVVLREATKQSFRTVDDLASVFCFWIERELSFGHYDEALEIARDAVLRPLTEYSAASQLSKKKRKHNDENSEIKAISIQARLARTSTKVWGLYLDLEESLGGSLSVTRAAYDRALELKVASPQMIINYAHLLIEKNYFEDGFRVYERGIALLEPAFVTHLWLNYARDLVTRFSNTKKERIRDFFERCLTKIEAAPFERKAPGHVQPEHAALLFLEYASFEEKHIIRRAMSIYERAARYVSERCSDSVAPTLPLKSWFLYCKKIEINYGATKARGAYEQAIKMLKSPHDAREACLQFARLETALGEIERARAVYAHGGQFAHPQLQTQYWDYWRDFEVAHGNEDTFRDMLRIKRSVQTALDVHTHFTLGTSKQQQSSIADNPSSIQQLEQQALPSTSSAEEPEITNLSEAIPERHDPNEIDLNLDDDDDDDEEMAQTDINNIPVEQRPVPAAVFGNVGQEHSAAVQAALSPPSTEQPPLGALARFRQQQRKSTSN